MGLLSVEEVAARVKVSTYTVRRWVRQGRLAGIKIGRDWRVDERDLEAFLAARRKEAALPAGGEEAGPEPGPERDKGRL